MFLKIIFGIKYNFRICQGNQDGSAEKKNLPNVTNVIFTIFEKKERKFLATNFKVKSRLLHQKSLLWQQNVQPDVSRYQMHSLHLLFPISLGLVPPLLLLPLPSKPFDLWTGHKADQMLFMFNDIFDINMI